MNNDIHTKNPAFSTTGMLKHSIVDCKIDRLGINGEGVATIDGITAFVQGALPGEIAKVRITDVHKTFIVGKLLERLNGSTSRVKPFCELFARCGGCQTMHLSYPEQTAYKRERIVSELTNRCGISTEIIQPCIPSQKIKNYRNKIELPFRMQKRNRTFGFFREGSHEIIRVESCPVHLFNGEKAYKAVRETILESGIPPYNESSHSTGLRHIIIRTSLFTGKAMAVLIGHRLSIEPLRKLANAILAKDQTVSSIFYSENNSKGNTVMGSKTTHLAGQTTLVEKIIDWQYEIGPSSFFQVNPFQAAEMVKTILYSTHLRSDDTVLDAYCGAGFLSIPIATKVKKVIGIEENSEAVNFANKNRKINNTLNATFIHGKSEKIIPEIEKCSVIIADPPRKGCEQSFLDSVVKMGPRVFIYVSCNPATLARDIRFLMNNGFKTVSVQPIDMFPQTAHIESVTFLINPANQNMNSFKD